MADFLKERKNLCVAVEFDCKKKKCCKKYKKKGEFCKKCPKA